MCDESGRIHVVNFSNTTIKVKAFIFLFYFKKKKCLRFFVVYILYTVHNGWKSNEIISPF